MVKSFIAICEKKSKRMTCRRKHKIEKKGRAGHSIVNTSKCIGADLLMKLLGNYCRNKDIKTSICVGIVGYPNVGKSSIINSLKRKSACNTGAMPGITKRVYLTLQEVHLDKKIRLIDTPGVALCSKDSYDRVEMALRNVIRVDLLEDPIAPVEAILRRCSKDSLILQYKISDFDGIDDFLCQVAKKIGRVKKGGIPDKRKIRYYTLPPETSTGVQLVSAELVTTMSKEFDLEALANDEKLIVEIC
uniref:G domain-containing protein n=1 Tax=Romanomermis culicivorax TaxID=13658 RepID=A0A915ICT5_ROMCU